MLPINDTGEPDILKQSLQPVKLTTLPTKVAPAPQPAASIKQPQPRVPVPQPASVPPTPAPLAVRPANPPAIAPVRRSFPPQATPAPTPLRAETPTKSPTPDLLLPTPAEPSPKLLREPEPPTPTPSPAPTGLGLTEIGGVPVDPSWQGIDAPNQALDEPELLLSTSSTGSDQLHPNIVGQIVKAPGGDPDEIFEKFYQNQLETAQFRVEQMGAYFPGGGLYKLSRQDLQSPLYLALAPAKDQSGTIVTVWNQFPQPVSDQ